MRADKRITSAASAPTFLTALLLIALALSVLVQANPATRLPGRDNGFYLYIGEQIVHGKLPYRDAWESKPPAIFYLNALALRLGRGSRWGVWMVEFASLLLALALSFHLFKKLWGMLPAFAGIAMWIYGLDRTLQGGNFTEEYPLPLHFMAVLLFLKAVDDPQRRRYPFLLGAVFALCFLFRPNNAVMEAAAIPALLGVLALRREPRAMLAASFWAGVGAAIPLLITGLYFWSHGLLRDLLEASILYNLTYSQTKITAASGLTTGFGLFSLAAWIAVAGYVVAAVRAYRRDPHWPLYLLLLISWPLVIALSDPAQRNYFHYFMNWLPCVGLLGALTVHALTDGRLAQPRASAALGAGLALAVAFLLLSGRAGEYRRALDHIARRAQLGVEARAPMSIYAENHTEPGDLVLFWPASPGENFMANRESPSAFLFYPLYVKSDISRRMNDQFLQDILTKRPELIIDTIDQQGLSLNPVERRRQIEGGTAWRDLPDNVMEFFAFVEQNYYLEAQVGNKTVYRLRGTQGE